MTGKKVVVVGAGLIGSLCALILTKNGFEVDLYERWPDIRTTPLPAGRSINLVLTFRGLRALKIPGLEGFIEELLRMTTRVLGRTMHSVKGELTFTPYGKDPSECNYSISRTDLNKFLLDKAEQAGTKVHFEHILNDVDFDNTILKFKKQDGSDVEVKTDFVIGCDGGGSAVRKNMKNKNLCQSSEELLQHGYKELTFPSDENGGYRMDKDSLHIWPRGNHMLMALSNSNGSYTGTIYLPNKGADSFESLQEDHDIITFFETNYPDAIPLLGGKDNLVNMWKRNVVGILGTVRCDKWNVGGNFCLMGDAAHAVVPFFGQGCNCGFEDVLIFEKILRQNNFSLSETFPIFAKARKPAADAIADMALENFVEMRDRVGDPNFIMRKKVENILTKSFPEKFRPRYPMVVYSSAPYNVVKAAGVVIDQVITELCEGITDAEQVDLTKAEQLICQQLTPFFTENGIDLTENWHAL